MVISLAESPINQFGDVPDLGALVVGYNDAHFDVASESTS